jgi:hypothetical protein
VLRARTSRADVPVIVRAVAAHDGSLPRWTFAAAVTALYAAIVVWGSVHHEPWRDEVVPLSIARQARSLAQLAEPLRFEGHPILWYLVLWSGWAVVGQTWVLKAASVAAAVGAVLLLNRSPLPWWIRLTFTFSFFPLYQYSVVSRGYCLVMLLLFAFCALYPRRREHPLALALVLAALANTEAFGFIVVVGAVVMLIGDAVAAGTARTSTVADRRVVGAVAIVTAALVLAALVALPDRAHRGTGFGQVDVRGLLAGVAAAIGSPAAHSARMVVVPVASAWIWAYFVYLTRRPPLLGFAAVSLVGFEALFNLAHGPGAPWHIGNGALVLVATMWLDATGPPVASRLPEPVQRGRRWLGVALAVGVTAVFADHVLLGIDYVRADVAYEHSASRGLAELLREDASLANAVVTGEPDTALWSLSYYADNPLYLPREDTFRAWGIFAPPRLVDYDLASLLSAAGRVRDGCGCPVVIALGWDLGTPGTLTNFPGTRFEERFVITPAARDAFVAATRPLARLRGPTITDENYDVYVLR